MEKSPIHDAMRRLAKTLSEMKIPFAVAGAMAANAHGHRRTTADVDLLIRPSDLEKFKQRWIGRGWIDKFEGSKGFRDTIHNVNIDVLLTGDFPGDGLPKPIVFPPPEAVIAEDHTDIPYISLQTLIELKLASGMTAAHRIQDMADVIGLIRANRLPREYVRALHPYVREKFEAMWRAAQVDEDF